MWAEGGREEPRSERQKPCPKAWPPQAYEPYWTVTVITAGAGFVTAPLPLGVTVTV